MSDDENYIEKKVPGRIYASKNFPITVPTVDASGAIASVIRSARYFDRVFPEQEGEAFAQIKKGDGHPHDVVGQSTDQAFRH